MLRHLLILLIIPLWTSGQLDDTSCVYARWIELSPTELNAKIFGLDSNLSARKDLVQVIKTYVELGQLNIYKQKIEVDGRMRWKYIDYKEEVDNAISNPLNISNWTPYFKRLGPLSDSPICCDEFGEPLIRVRQDGFEEYIYPEREVFELFTKNVDKIWIKETIQYNVETKTNEFVASDIAFCVAESKDERAHDLFWVNIEEFFDLLENRNSYPWYNSIITKQYFGFQFKQTSCENSLVNFLESRHPIILDITDSCSYYIPFELARYNRELVLKTPKGCKDGITVFLEGTGQNVRVQFLTANPKTGFLTGTEYNRELEMHTIKFNSSQKGTADVKYRPCHSVYYFTITVE